MFAFSANDFLLTLAGVALVMGVITFLIGIVILAFKVRSDEFNQISAHTAKLMDKGIVENVAGLVDNTSNLLAKINEMARTKAGVGMFLILITFILLGAAYFLVTRIP